MKHTRWQLFLGLGLIALSAVIYLGHFFIFHDSHHIFIYLLGDIAFVPIEVLLVTLIIHRLLSNREKKLMFEKLNMVIGTFFSMVGTKLLVLFSDADPSLGTIKAGLVVNRDWDSKMFLRISKKLRTYEYAVDVGKIDLQNLRMFLLDTRDFLVRLLENPVLLEHQPVTDLLRATFHLMEELANRESIRSLPESDRKHLGGDIKRVYILLVHRWLDYMKYLKNNYPYLFSLAMRTNPFDTTSTVVVQA